MSFIPDQPKMQVDVPYFEEARSEDGWQGQATTKTIEKLQDEITKVISRLGGIVTGYQRGTFQMEKYIREGFQIHYAIHAPNGMLVPGRLDIAALPVHYKYDSKRKDKSLRMALYMLREALDGMWFLQKLSPGYAGLMPWMLGEGGKTVTQMWAESATMSNLLPPGESEFVEGEVREIG
jgi:hypothetical protein